jgi:restriction endonuclease S subunit
MASRRKRILTPEEQLEAALVPKNNQKGLSAIKVPIPTEAEQRFFSESLDAYFEYSREAESQAMEALQ